MTIVHVKATQASCQVDDFPAAAARSVKGALYIRPSSTLEMTSDELAHIKAKHPAIAASLIEVPQPKRAQKAPRAALPAMEEPAPAPVGKKQTK